MIKALEKLRIETLKSSSELVKNHTEICCAVCIENFETGTQVRYLTCGHPYHKKVSSRDPRTKTDVSYVDRKNVTAHAC